jgi:hypothetical protein
VTEDGPTLFVALARLTAEPDPVALPELVSVRVADSGELLVRWGTGREVRARLGEGGVEVVVS